MTVYFVRLLKEQWVHCDLLSSVLGVILLLRQFQKI